MPGPLDGEINDAYKVCFMTETQSLLFKQKLELSIRDMESLLRMSAKSRLYITEALVSVTNGHVLKCTLLVKFYCNTLQQQLGRENESIDQQECRWLHFNSQKVINMCTASMKVSVSPWILLVHLKLCSRMQGGRRDRGTKEIEQISM